MVAFFAKVVKKKEELSGKLRHSWSYIL